MSQTPTVGRVVLVVVPKSTNDGLDHAPALITRVNPDGTVNLHALVDIGGSTRLAGVTLYQDRAAAQTRLADEFVHLPGATSREEPNGDVVAVPGRNSTNGEPWNHSDVAHWHKIAYWPAAPAAPETPEQRAAREATAAAELAAATARRRAQLEAELASLAPAE